MKNTFKKVLLAAFSAILIGLVLFSWKSVIFPNNLEIDTVEAPFCNLLSDELEADTLQN